MANYAVFLRAINVGGTGKLPMAELRALLEELGFSNVATYIQSGNVVLSSKHSRAETIKRLQAAMKERVGTQGGVAVLTGKELNALLESNPFPSANPSRVIVHLLGRKVTKEDLADIATPDGEEVESSSKAVYVHYPAGQGRSKVKLPFAKESTGRNLNTLRKVHAMLTDR